MRLASIPLATILVFVGSAAAASSMQNPDVSPADEVGPGTTQASAEETGNPRPPPEVRLKTAREDASPAVDSSTHVVLMIDKSGSTQPGGDLTVQLAGYALALERPDVGDALAHVNADITVIAWSGANEQLLLIDRAIITGENSAHKLATEIRGLPLAAGGLTDLPSAVGYAIAHLDRIATRDQCNVIIVSTDQLSGAGYFVTDAQEKLLRAHDMRAMAVEHNIIIHGFGLEDSSVASYLRNNVATPGGEVSFIPSDASLADSAARLLSSDFCRLFVASSPVVPLPA